MRDIVLHGAAWKTKDDFYDAFLSAVEAPNWHGHNLDALWDSIVTGDINKIELPYRIVVDGLSGMSEESRVMVGRFVELIEEARVEGAKVEILCLDAERREPA